MPSGVARANRNNITFPFGKSCDSKFFWIEIPKEREAADLCMNKPSMMLKSGAISEVSPRAIPSKNAWVHKATKRTKDCRYEAICMA